MSRTIKKTHVILIWLTILSIHVVCYGLAMERIGPDIDNKHPTVAQPDWSKGIVEVLRHRSRVYSRWVNGNDNFYFNATPNEINELLVLFSKARMRDHEVIISLSCGWAKELPNGGKCRIRSSRQCWRPSSGLSTWTGGPKKPAALCSGTLSR